MAKAAQHLSGALPEHLQGLKIAIVHDWLVGGGAERVVYQLHQLFPDAPVYTSYCSDEWRAKMDGKVITGFLQHWPFGPLRKFVGLLRIWWFTHLDFSGYDLVISSTGNGEAKSIHTPKSTTHVCYCHTPVHYYWRHYDLYMNQPGFGVFNGLARLGLRLLVKPLRKWDLKASTRPDYYIANSTHIQADIKKYYGRDSVVIHPPVDIARFASAVATKRAGFVMASRQVPQKKFDLAIQACNKLKLPLTVVGKGPEHAKLVAMAGPTITFAEHVSDAEMADYLSTAEAFLWPSYEDFGVTPVEAMAAGTPVIAYSQGGSRDYVVPGKTGLFFDQQTVDSLCYALQALPSYVFDPKIIRAKANTFSPTTFNTKTIKFLSGVM